LILNNPNCATAANSLFTCSATSAVSCDAQGKAQLDSCGAQGLTAAACFLTNATDPTLAGPCATMCSKEAALHCPNDMLSGCQTGCQVTGGFIPSCSSDWRSYVNCAASSTTWMCDSSGKASPGGSCFVPAIVYFACVLGSLSQDAGASD
jgi:hypothetical protein